MRGKRSLAGERTSSGRNKDASEMGTVNFGDGNDSRSPDFLENISVLIRFPVIPDHVRALLAGFGRMHYGRTGRRTDKASYRDVRTHLKKELRKFPFCVLKGRHETEPKSTQK